MFGLILFILLKRLDFREGIGIIKSDVMRWIVFCRYCLDCINLRFRGIVELLILFSFRFFFCDGGVVLVLEVVVRMSGGSFGKF